MKRVRRDPVRFEVFDLLAQYAQGKKLSIRDDDTMTRFLDDARESNRDRLANDAFVHGRRVEAMFETVIASIGHVQLIKQEDAGECFYSGEDICLPDFRVVTANGTQVLVEVKNHYQRNGLEPQVEKVGYLAKLSRYADLTGADLLLATYWTRWNRWTLVSVDDFESSQDKARLSFEKANLHNRMSVLGDRLIGTRAPLRLCVDVVEKSHRGTTRTLAIRKTRILSEERVLTDKAEQQLAMFLLLHGGWEETTEMHESADGAWTQVEFAMSPEDQARMQDKQGFEMMDALSAMFSRQFREATSRDGAVHAVREVLEPGLVTKLIPYDYPYGDGDLPLWVFEQSPSLENSDGSLC